MNLLAQGLSLSVPLSIIIVITAFQTWLKKWVELKGTFSRRACLVVTMTGTQVHIEHLCVLFSVRSSVCVSPCDIRSLQPRFQLSMTWLLIQPGKLRPGK